MSTKSPRHVARRTRSLHTPVAEQPQLSLSRRFHIARQLTQVVLHLHAAGWLHKSLRSSNIIFLAPNDASADEFLNKAPYLIGYEYTRPDTAQAVAFIRLPDTALETDLYRHPHARGVGREKYRKQFDMYALGCVLVEVGMWRRLLDVKIVYVNNSLGEVITEATALDKDVDLPSLLRLRAKDELVDAL